MQPCDALSLHSRLVEVLRTVRPFTHPVLRVETIETHISTVLLAGEFAYKLKKPVNLGFVDFTTLERRRQCCEDEVRLNRRTAPHLYLGVVPITGTIERPLVAGDGEPIEYAVRMRRFAHDATFDTLPILPHQITALAALVAAFHRSVPVADPGSGFGRPEQIQMTALDNFRQCRMHVEDRAGADALARLEAWTRNEFERLAATFEERLRRGFVRECHGDLHLGNVALIDGKPVPFDCIEFSAPLRWIDVISEVAFTVMDLIAHGDRSLAFRFLNAYLEETGDYEGVAVLRFYLVYRAMVRAKIAAIQRRRQTLERYLRLAEELSVRRADPGLVITCGLSGSGKTTFARALAGSLGALHIRSDVERKRMHGIRAEARAPSAIGAGIYTLQASAATYERLARLARSVVASGFPVIVDATFLRRGERHAFRDLARRIGARFVIARCEAPLPALRARLLARGEGQDASDATPVVLERQLANREGFMQAEAEAAVTCDTLDRRRVAQALVDVENRLAA